MRAFSASKAIIQAEGPFRGPTPFTGSADDRATFFGREKAVDSLLSLALANKLIVVYGKSGTGKTSIINAGLMPRLNEKKLQAVSVRFGHLRNDSNLKDDVESSHLASAYVVKELLSFLWPKKNENPLLLPHDSTCTLWSYLYSRQILNKNCRGCVIVLDQFEEFFYLKPSADPRAFLEEINAITNSRPPGQIIAAAERALAEKSYKPEAREHLISLARGDASLPVKFVISVREDFLPQIDQLTEYLPGVMRNTFRVRPLRVEEARRAISDTLRVWNKKNVDRNFEIEDKAVEAILSFLADRSTLGSSAIEIHRAVDPTQLQILLDGLYKQERFPSKKARIISEAKAMTLGKVLKNYYFKTLRLFPVLKFGPNARGLSPDFYNLLICNFPRAAVAALCEYGLVLNGKTRNILPFDTVQKRFGVPGVLIDRLHLSRLVMPSQSQGGEKLLELAHDSLIPMLGAAKSRRGRNRKTWAVVTFFFLLASWHFYLAKVVAAAHWAPPLTRLFALNYLGKTGRTSGINLTGVDFRNSDGLVNMQMTGVNLYGVYVSLVKDSNLDNANLTESHLARAWFTKVRLSEAQLDRSDARWAFWDESDLGKADFTSARIDHSTFRNSNLYETKFYNVDVSGTSAASRINMSGSNWWMSRGWSEQDQDTFYKRGFVLEDYANSSNFDNEFHLRCNDVINSQGNIRAENLNGLAWFLITDGGSVSAAAAYLNKANELATEPATKSNIAETLGELQLRVGKYREAEEIYAAIGLGVGRDNKSWQYRHALASYLADKKLPRPSVSGYVPSYEHVVFELAKPSSPKETNQGNSKCDFD